MDYGIKVFNNTNEKQAKEMLGPQENAHILLVLAVPYLKGAYEQLDRYELATSHLTKQNAVDQAGVCLYEVSSLFEDVCIVSKYLTELCHYQNNNHQLWLDARNHIRHDVRENFDTNNTYYI